MPVVRISLPKDFNEITVGQFQECYFINKSDPSLEGWARIISILSGKPYEEVINYQVDVLKAIKKRLLFLLDDEDLNTKVKKYIYVKGHVYKAVYEANKLSAAQGIDLKEFMKGDMDQKDIIVENAHKLLASIYLRLGWSGFKYRGDIHQEVSEDFKKCKVGDVWGTLFFYSSVFPKLTQCFQDSMKESLEIIQEHAQALELWASKKDSITTGDGRSPSMKSRAETQ